MAITTITLNDDDFVPSTGENMAYCESDNLSGYKFRFLLELTYYTNFDSGNPSGETKTIRFTQQPSQQYGVWTSCVFNLTEIINSIVTPQITSSNLANPPDPSTTTPTEVFNIHALPSYAGSNSSQQIFSNGILKSVPSIGNSHIRGVSNAMILNFYEMYSLTEDGIPVKDQNTQTTKKMYVFKARGQSDYGALPSIKNVYGQYSNGSDKPVLTSNYYPSPDSNFDYEINIGKDEFHTMAFIGRHDLTPASIVDAFQIKYYQTNGTYLGQATCRMNSNTGAKFWDTYTENTYPDFYRFCGVGFENLNRVTFDPNDPSEDYYGSEPQTFEYLISSGLYYTFELGSISPSNVFTGVSALYKFNIVSYCDKYEHTRLAYMNKFGAWEYITLNKKKEEKLKVEKEYITKPLLNQSFYPRFSSGYDVPNEYINSAYPLNVAKRGKMATSVRPTEHLTLFTDNLKDYQIEQIKDMMMSPEIHDVTTINAESLILENTEMKLKGSKNTGLYEYELKFSYANPKNRKW